MPGLSQCVGTRSNLFFPKAETTFLAVQMPACFVRAHTECPFLAQLLLALAWATIWRNSKRKDVLGDGSGIHYCETRQEPFLLGKECLQTLIVKEKPAWLIPAFSPSSVSVFCKCFNIAYLDSSWQRPLIHFGLKKWSPENNNLFSLWL